MWEWTLYDGEGEVVAHETAFETYDHARADFNSYKMALQSDKLWVDEYEIIYEPLVMPTEDPYVYRLG